jgi:metal-dependent amidase/aminoacylase/carboxypeptidase family protein
MLDPAVIGKVAAEIDDELMGMRRDIHRYPELAGDERRTSALVARRLRAAGLAVTTGVGGHGVVAVLDGVSSGPTVAFRADMDAVDDDELSDCAFASQVAGAAHLCGHDLHTAIAVGIAVVLARLREQLNGRVVFVFQPAEETCEGARAMIEDGVLSRTVDRPATPGQFRQLAEDMQTPDGPLARFVVAGSALSSGEDGVCVHGWLRAWPDDRYAAIRDDVRRWVDALPGARVEFTKDPFPSMICSPPLNAAANTYLRGALGADAVMALSAAYPFNGDDFAFFLHQVPGAMFYLGVANQDEGLNAITHSPYFAADETAIGFGVRAMAGFLSSRLAALG